MSSEFTDAPEDEPNVYDHDEQFNQDVEDVSQTYGELSTMISVLVSNTLAGKNDRVREQVLELLNDDFEFGEG